ncbi:MAG: peptidase T, partial [Desulfobacterales bacterium]|nr:peptidase T [Desulfobacterales bacterium]
MLHRNIEKFLLKEAKERFLRYVRVDTASDPDSGRHPSTETQKDLARLLEKELRQIGLTDVEANDFCYVYATLPASEGVDAPPVTFCAHMDTSSSEPGKDVHPVIHENYDGGAIAFKDDPALTLDPEIAPALLKYKGDNIITASGKTLLGADDKAGIAEIMAALAALTKFEALVHPELRVIFTPDEEIGEGPDNIDRDRFGEFGYTIDGGEMGEIEAECFDAYMAEIVFNGKNIHPGYAKNKMLNAGAIAARFFSALPEYETPERTEKREGFYHLLRIRGDESRALLKIIIRDFERVNNLKR